MATIWPATVQKVLGDSAIANSVGNIHKFRRNAFLKAFTREALNEYVLIIQESVREKVSLLKLLFCNQTSTLMSLQPQIDP